MASISTNVPNASFIGFVTRKDKDTGVNLVAKIVTPSKKLSLEKLVRVKIKANALDDYACCVIDHAAIKKVIENSQDLDAINDSFQFLYNGEHGTTIKYSIEGNGDDNSIKDYLGDDGTLIGRPKYSVDGTSDAVGSIIVSVTKGTAKVSSKIPIHIKGMSAGEVLESDIIYKNDADSIEEYLWNKIENGNGLYLSKGHHSIKNRLLFTNMEEIPLKDSSNVITGLGKISDTPITCSWSLCYQDGENGDGVGESMRTAMGTGDYAGVKLFEDIYIVNGKGSRICMNKEDAEHYGDIYRPSYKVTCSSLYDDYATLCSQNDSANDRYFRIGKPDANAEKNQKLHLIATLSLGGSTKVVHYYCATLSKYLTSSEISEFISDVTKISYNNSKEINTEDWQPFGTKEVIELEIPNMTEGSPAPSSAKDHVITVCGVGFYLKLSEQQRKQLALGPDTLKNIITIPTPVLYKAKLTPGDLGSKPVSVPNTVYAKTSSLFEPSFFAIKDLPVDATGVQVDDYSRYLVIAKEPTLPSKGLYEASNILSTLESTTIPDSDKDWQSAAFCLHYTVRINSVGERDENGDYTTESSSQKAEFDQLFKLVRTL